MHRRRRCNTGLPQSDLLARGRRRALNLLKFLTNELKIVIVAVGTSDAYHALQTDVQVASRFEPLLIPRWTETEAFRAFIVA